MAYSTAVLLGTCQSDNGAQFDQSNFQKNFKVSEHNNPF